MSAVTDAAKHPRPVWGSSRAYVLATIAGVVGLGNIWRFPYMAGRHGGGSFLVAYTVSVIVIAVPLATVESAAGGLSRRSPVGSFRRAAGRSGALVGWAVMAMTVAILSYYLVITGWTMGYAVDSYRNDIRPFHEFTQGHTSLWFFLAVGVLCYVVLRRGIATFERVSLYLVPILVLVVVGLAAYTWTLEGGAGSRAFYFGVSGDHLADTATWRAAAGQAFYSIGVGQGVLIAYGSFVPAGTNLLRSTTTIALTNGLVSIISAMMVLAVAFTFDLSPSAGSELSFTAFPRVFAQMPGGALLAALFFTLLLVAGFTSCLGASVVTLTTVRDELGLTHARAVGLTILVVMVLGVPSALSFTDVGLNIGGEPFLDRVDQFTGSGVIVVLGLIGTAVLARNFPRRALAAAFNADGIRVAGVTIGPRAVIRWAVVLPGVAAVLFVGGRILS